MIVRPALSRGEGIPSAELLYSCVQEHEGNLTRLVKLRELASPPNSTRRLEKTARPVTVLGRPP